MRKQQAAGRLIVAAVLMMGVAPRNAVAEEGLRMHRTDVAMVDALLAVSSDDGQTEDHLFDGTDRFAAKAKETSEVNLDKSMLNMAAKKGGKKGEIARKLDAVVVRTYEFANEGDYKQADLQTILNRLNGDGWKHVVRTRDGREMTDICMKQDGEGVTKEMVIVTAEPKEITLIHLRGNNIDMSDLHSVGGMASYAMHGSGSTTSTSSTTTSPQR